MTIENGQPFTPGSPADRWQASAGKVRELPSTITFILRLAAILVMTIVPAGASDFSTRGAEVNTRTLFHRVAVFSDAPDSIHDPRHPQSQTGATKCSHLSDSSGPITLSQTKAQRQGQIFIWERPSLFRHATS